MKDAMSELKPCPDCGLPYSPNNIGAHLSDMECIDALKFALQSRDRELAEARFCLQEAIDVIGDAEWAGEKRALAAIKERP